MMQTGTWEASFQAAIIGTLVMLGISVLLTVVAVLFRLRNGRRRRITDALRAQWHPTFVSYLAHQASSEAVTGLVRTEDHDIFIDFVADHAVRLIGKEREHVAQLTHDMLAIVREKLMTGNSIERVNAMHTIAILKPGAFLVEIESQLTHPEVIVSISAMRSLAREKSVNSLPKVFEQIERFELWHRSMLITTLTRFGPGALPFFRSIVADADRSDLVTAVALETLSELTDQDGVHLVPAVLERAHSRKTVLACLHYLARVGQAEHASIAREHLDDGDYKVRCAAIDALSRTGTDQDLPPRP